MGKKPFCVGDVVCSKKNVHFKSEIEQMLFQFEKGVVLQRLEGRVLVRNEHGQQFLVDEHKLQRVRKPKLPTLKQVEAVIDRILRIREDIFLDWTDNDSDLIPLLKDVADAANVTYIHCGGYRIAFSYRGLVIKVPFDSKGAELNMLEKDLWDKTIVGTELEPFFVPCIHLYKGYSVYAHAYAFEHHLDYALFKNEIETAHTVVSNKLIPMNREHVYFLRDLQYAPKAKSHRWRNWGLFNQQPVMLDYAI